MNAPNRRVRKSMILAATGLILAFGAVSQPAFADGIERAKPKKPIVRKAPAPQPAPYVAPPKAQEAPPPAVEPPAKAEPASLQLPAEFFSSGGGVGAGIDGGPSGGGRLVIVRGGRAGFGASVGVSQRAFFSFSSGGSMSAPRIAHGRGCGCC